VEEALLTASQVLASHGYLIVFVWVFLDQAALPLPSIPVLIAAGALVATGSLGFWAIIVTATVAALLADILWYQLGKRGGNTAITYVCKLSLEPESCVTTTRNAFGRFGPATLVIAKYLPGVQTLAPASAGFVGAPFLGFLAPYIAFKAGQWAMFYKGHKLRRLSPEELHARLERGEDITVIDLRQRLDYELQPFVIPGALRIPISEIPKRQHEVPNHLDVALVCT